MRHVVARRTIRLFAANLNFRCARTQAHKRGQFSPDMLEFFDRIVEHVNGIKAPM